MRREDKQWRASCVVDFDDNVYETCRGERAGEKREAKRKRERKRKTERERAAGKWQSREGAGGKDQEELESGAAVLAGVRLWRASTVGEESERWRDCDHSRHRGENTAHFENWVLSVSHEDVFPAQNDLDGGIW